MLTQQTKPLEIARKYLNQDTIDILYGIDGRTINHSLILDRWALNSPEKLVALQNEGSLILIQRLTNQWKLEEDTMDSEEYYNMETDGMSKWEIFRIMGINTELE